jgi:hypothetical protein
LHLQAVVIMPWWGITLLAVACLALGAGIDRVAVLARIRRGIRR